MTLRLGVPVVALALATVTASSRADETPTRTYRNPILGGFHSDPSICRVGEDYYLATSSFAFFPGVPIHHSRDLVNWRLIGNALDRAEQLPLPGGGIAAGIWAPTLRHHRGTFFLVTTNKTKGGNFLVTAKDPAGPWSKPVWFDPDGWDPDLFFDDDGRVYLTRNGQDETGAFGLLQYEIDLKTGRRLSKARIVSTGSGGFGPEGPHIYKRNGVYYLLVAEGGTHAGHMVTVFRGKSPSGPFEPAPHNPILTHRDRLLERVQATGHGDLVEAKDGSWWLVFLGIRNWASPMHMMHVLGRETFLAPVRFRDDGWPVVNEGRPIREEMSAALPPAVPWPAAPVRDGFEGPRLRPHWVYLRNPTATTSSLVTRPGFLSIPGTAATPSDAPSAKATAPGWVGRRIRDPRFRAATHVTFDAVADGDEAGLSVFLDERHHYDLALVRRDGRRSLVVRRTFEDLQGDAASIAAPEGSSVGLEVEGNPWSYTFYVVTAAGRVPLAKVRSKLLSTEVAGGFTGPFVGLYATGNGKATVNPAFFDWFEYEGLPEPVR